MVRYTPRPWYSPLGFMASAPTGYGPLLVAIGVVIAWPLRYQLSEYFERQKDGPHIELRQRAVKYYNELERMHRRQAMLNLENMEEDTSGLRLHATLSAEALRVGHTDMEYQYWNAHQRDAMRTEKLLMEIADLKEKIAAEEGGKKK
ncbi:hypothetical protein STCU_00344 [Strigomonas culicis]|uniref:Uncharacterized protein n=1 Tax=Strigomonas culicis TaxID=28005 RepID=S9V7T9_9TRYP|nr:hypothetical protein STCU_00344 [Strigomonas culicis]|eukprot:EPY36913.1 hypothetical protein STCU_00344 [Strigomonas culicis]